MRRALLYALLMLTFGSVSTYAQEHPEWLSWQGAVSDATGAVVSGAHIYTRDSYGDPSASVIHLDDSKADGSFVLPPFVKPRDIIVFASGFRPYIGFVNAGPATVPVKVVMTAVGCDSPLVTCDTVGAIPATKRRAKKP